MKDEHWVDFVVIIVVRADQILTHMYNNCTQKFQEKKWK